MEPSAEIPFIMSFAAPKLWALIGESYITLSPEKMVGAVVSSLGADPNDPGSISAVVEEIKRCLFQRYREDNLRYLPEDEVLAVLDDVGGVPEDLSYLWWSCMRSVIFFGYLPPPAYKSEPSATNTSL